MAQTQKEKKVEYTFMFLTAHYAKKHCAPNRRFILTVCGAGIVFAALMLSLRSHMYINIAVTVAFVFGIFGYMYWMNRRAESKF